MFLITGASSGIGQSCAELLAARKHPLILAARRIDRLDALADQLRKRHGVTVHAFRLDVSKRSEIERFCGEHSALLAGTTALINNAGGAHGLSLFQDGNPDDWETMIDTNLKGLLHLTRGVLPHLLKRGEGHIVNIGSVAGRWTYPRGNVYCAAKFAVHGFSEALRLDLSGSGIRVTEISPGMVETEFSEVRLRDKEKAKAVYSGMTALTAQDVAETVVWALGRPRHVNVQEIVLYPTDQASPAVVHRR